MGAELEWANKYFRAELPRYSCSNHQFTTSYCVQGVISSVLLHYTLTELQLGCIIGAQLAEL
jgi:hypothetical protein